MTNRTRTILATVLTVLFLADTGGQVYRLTQNQPTTFYGMILLVPIVWLLKGAAVSATGDNASSKR